MKSFFVSATMIIVLFLYAMNNTEAQQTKAKKPKQPTKQASTKAVPSKSDSMNYSKSVNLEAVVKEMNISVGIASAYANTGMNSLAPLAQAGEASPDNQKKEKDAHEKIRVAANKITGESFSGQEAASLVIVLYNWTFGRGYENLDTYPLRIRHIDKKLLEDWQVAQENLGVRQKQLTLILLGIIFQDQFWEGVNWKPRYPQWALRRLKSLTKDAVTQWTIATNISAVPFAAGNSLISVDDLFANDAFQKETFDRALAVWSVWIKE